MYNGKKKEKIKKILNKKIIIIIAGTESPTTNIKDGRSRMGKPPCPLQDGQHNRCGKPE
jgi:hypothetical protein